MSAPLDNVIDALQSYREKYQREFLDVPDHEIVMHPATYRDLMDDPIAVHNVDHAAGFRNFQGIPLLTNTDSKAITVRDRTVRQ